MIEFVHAMCSDAEFKASGCRQIPSCGFEFILLFLQGPGHRPESFMYIPWDLRLIQFDAGGTGAGGALVLLASIA